MAVDWADVVSAGAAFVGSYLGQVRTRGELRVLVKATLEEQLRPRARRVWVALAGLGRRVRALERGDEAGREA